MTAEQVQQLLDLLTRIAIALEALQQQGAPKQFVDWSLP
jgi:hypothetical protein